MGRDNVLQGLPGEARACLGLSQLLSNLVSDNPFAAQAPPLAQYANGLPQNEMVGENEATITMREGNGYIVRTPDGVWIEGKP